MKRSATIAMLVVAGLLLTACGPAVETTDDRPTHGAPSVATPSGPLGEQDGVVPDGAPLSTDSELPAVANLEPALRDAIRAAAAAAAADGVELTVTSGWRSERYQQALLDAAITTYGSEEEAAVWVATPQTSMHVRGAAVDIGPTDANSWLSQHGANWRLCQTYSNEMWHWELADLDADGYCPVPYVDPTHDPRMR